MKRAFAILTLALLLLPSFIKIGVFIHFKANQDFIADVFCVNKEEPMLMCSGKCYLNEQLTKVKSTSEKEQAPPSSFKSIELPFYYYEELFALTKPKTINFLTAYPAYKNIFYKLRFTACIDHPPKFNVYVTVFA